MRNGHGNRRSDEHGDPSVIFKEIYETGWFEKGKPGSSGKGSSAEERKPYVDYVVRRFAEWQPATVVDLGCGDGRVIADIASQYDGAKYTGIDVYTPHLEMLGEKLGHHQWKSLDLTDVAKIPKADVWLCKDVLHHWPNNMVRRFTTNVTKAKRCKWLILCHDRNQRFPRENCPLGGYRALNPEWNPYVNPLAAPFEDRVDFLHKTILSIRIK